MANPKGRPRIFPPGEDRFLRVTISKEQYEYLSKLAHDSRKSTSHHIREWITEQMAWEYYWKRNLKCVVT